MGCTVRYTTSEVFGLTSLRNDPSIFLSYGRKLSTSTLGPPLSTQNRFQMQATVRFEIEGITLIVFGNLLIAKRLMLILAVCGNGTCLPIYYQLALV